MTIELWGTILVGFILISLTGVVILGLIFLIWIMFDKNFCPGYGWSKHLFFYFKMSAASLMVGIVFSVGLLMFQEMRNMVAPNVDVDQVCLCNKGGE